MFKLLIGTVLMTGLCVNAVAATVRPSLLPNGSIGITVDENCNGVLNGFDPQAVLPCGFQDDPGPGGLAGALTYDLLNPPGLVAGDILMATQWGVIEDVIRFNPNGGPGNPGGTGSIVFYSDGSLALDSGADTLFAPSVDYANTIVIPETENGNVGFAVYTPTAGQPGFVSGAAVPVTYTFVSDAPEPASLSLVACGAVLLALRRRRR